MWSNNKLKYLYIMLCCSLVVGCATPEQNQQMFGAAGGALLGCMAGALISGNAKGCAVGAAAGAAVGWGTVQLTQYNATQVRSADKDQRMYGLTSPVQSTTVKIRSGKATPDKVRQGQQVQIVTDYSLLIPQGMSGSEVVKSWVLKKDGQVLTNVPPQRIHREAGGYAVDATIPIPANAAPGTYVVETKVQAGTSYDIDQTVFVVAS